MCVGMGTQPAGVLFAGIHGPLPPNLMRTGAWGTRRTVRAGSRHLRLACAIGAGRMWDGIRECNIDRGQSRLQPD